MEVKSSNHINGGLPSLITGGYSWFWFDIHFLSEVLHNEPWVSLPIKCNISKVQSHWFRLGSAFPGRSGHRSIIVAVESLQFYKILWPRFHKSSLFQVYFKHLAWPSKLSHSKCLRLSFWKPGGLSKFHLWNIPSGKLTVRPWQSSGLEDYFPFKNGNFQGLCLHTRG